MATFRDIAELALIELGQLTAGAPASDDEVAHAMTAFIYWLDQESISGLMQTERERLAHTFDGAGGLQYAIGRGQTIDLDLPAQLEEILYKEVNDTDSYPLDFVSLESISRHASVEATGVLMYNIEKSVPVGAIRFDAPPRDGDQVIFVGSVWLTVARENASPNMQIGLPRGYDRAFYLNLALELAPAYGVQIDRETRKRAEDAMSKIKYRNLEPSDVEFDPALSRFQPYQL